MHIIKQPFRWAHHGYQIEEFEPGAEPVALTDECAAVAEAEGWAVPADEKATKPRANKARDAAPENKSEQ